MIHSLHLTNFQSHADTTLDFHSGVNVIIGPSDSGKTAVVRALRWIVENQPGGDGYRRHDTQETEAALVVEGPDGPLTVTRTRKGKKLNAYYLSTSPDPYKALGRGGVPEDIEAILNLGSLNLEHQHDAPFLLSSNPGEVGRILNQVVNLEEIDDAIRRANSRVQGHKLDATTHGNDLLRIEADLEALTYIDDMDADVVEVETNDKELRETTERIRDLERAVGIMENAQETVERWAPFAVAGPEVAQLEQILNLQADTTGRMQTVALLASDLTYAQNQVSHWARSFAAVSALQLVEELQTKRTDLDFKCRILAAITRDYQTALAEADEKGLLEARRNLDAAVPDTCPTCGQPWPGENET